MTWPSSAPRIKLLSDTIKRKPYPPSWTEQGNLFSLLPNHLSDMALFAVNADKAESPPTTQPPNYRAY